MSRSENDRERRSETTKPRASRPAAPRTGAAAKSPGRTKAAAEKAGPKPTTARPAASRAGKAAAALRAVTADDVRLRAYEIYLRRGCSHGLDVEDWLQAERELKALHKID